MYIAIAGNIGSGKSTLTSMLARHYRWEPCYESVEQNPYLEDYYRDIERWSFNLEIYFLKERFRDLIAIQQSEKTVVQDRTIFEGVHVFMRNNYDMGHLSARDYQTCLELFDEMLQMVRLPDLLIYIRASVSTLVAQIQKRGREYEQTMRLDYLQGLERRYEEWISAYQGPLIIIDGDHCKFGDDPSAFKQVTDKIDAKLFGLFPME